MELGDLVVMPLKTVSQIAIGRIVGDYRYLVEQEREQRHVRPVQWKVDDIPRTAIKQDLLHSLGAFSTICEISRNDAAHRVEQLLNTQVDPGARTSLKTGQLPAATAVETSAEGDTGSIEDVERYALDQITSRVIERFSGHYLAELVKEILTAEGFTCEASPPGADQGIDVVAGRGLLGLDAPRLLVQVKSELTPVGSQVVQQLEGVISQHGADQGLLVAWGGITRDAQRMVNSRRFAVKVWNAEDVLGGVFRNYHRLPVSTQDALPLKQIWTLADGSS